VGDDEECRGCVDLRGDSFDFELTTGTPGVSKWFFPRQKPDRIGSDMTALPQLVQVVVALHNTGEALNSMTVTVQAGQLIAGVPGGAIHCLTSDDDQTSAAFTGGARMRGVLLVPGMGFRAGIVHDGAIESFRGTITIAPEGAGGIRGY